MTATDAMTAPPTPSFRRDRIAHTWLGLRAVSEAGDELWTIALAWTAVHVASPAAAGAVVAAGTVPRAAVLLLGGVVADRYDTRRVMALANAARIGVLLLVVARVLMGPPSLTVLLGAAIAFGLTDAVYEPSATTIGRQLVAPTDMPAYQGFSQTAMRLGSMGGAAVGGFVVAAWGIGTSAALDAATFAAVAVFVVLWLRPRYPLPRAQAEPPLRAIGRGFAHLREEPVTRALVIALSGLNLFVGPAEGVGLALRARQEGWGAGVIGVLVALIGAGAAIGAVVVAFRRPRRPAVAGFVWLLPQGLAVVLQGQGSPVLAGVAAAIIGVTAGAASTLLSSTFSTVVDGAYFGRMSAIQRLGDDVLMPVATIGFGALAAAVSVSAAFAAFGLAMVAFVLLPLLNPRIRHL